MLNMGLNDLQVLIGLEEELTDLSFFLLLYSIEAEKYSFDKCLTFLLSPFRISISA